MSELKSLIKQRGIIKGQITRFAKSLEKKTVTISEVSSRLEVIDSVYNNYIEVQCSIEEYDENEAKDREAVEDTYFQAVGRAKELCKEKPKMVADIKLAAINVPIFNGDYTMWHQFKDSFSCLIGNNAQLTNVQKFHYLLNSLKGDALRLISSLEVSDKNYKVVWDILEQRYDNTRIITDHHIHTLFNLPYIKTESSSKLRKIVDEAQLHLRALEGLGYKIEHWDPLIIYIVVTKLDSNTKNLWENSPIQKDTPSLKELIEFINQRARILEAASIRNPSSSKTSYQTNISVDSPSVSCILCKEVHKLDSCTIFRKMNVSKRWQTIRKLKICGNCLKGKHFSRDCNNKSRCSQCGKKHHSLIHRDERVESVDSLGSPSENIVATHTSCSDTQVLLSTAIVGVKRYDGSIYKVRALLDNGSQSNFLTEKVCREIGIPSFHVDASVSGIQGHVKHVPKGVNITINSNNSGYCRNINCLVVKNITQNIPQYVIDKNLLKIPKGIILADPQFDESSEIDMLLGADIFWQILEPNRVSLGPSQPIIQKTQLGYILGGQVATKRSNWDNKVCCNMSNVNSCVEPELEMFWKLEGVDYNQNSSDSECESHFKSTVKRSASGRFIVHIPWKEKPNIGHSTNAAIKRLCYLEKKFEKDANLKKEYVNCMLEYEQLGHMVKCEPSFDENVCYLGHHAVFKNSKIRVVFDASAKTSNGLSINDCQFTGPTVQNDIFTILINFRLHPYAYTADVKQMYRQILLDEKDQDFQRIVWRKSSDEEITHYKLTTVTFGMRSSPYLATRCLVELSKLFRNEYPLACKAIQQNTYMDDILSGCDSKETFYEIRKQLIFIFGTIGMTLGKWQCNVNDFISNDCNVERSLDIEQNSSCKVLGLHWNSVKDTLTYRVNKMSNNNVCTKRNILSDICKLYDPIGLLSPVVLRAKLIIQGLWKNNIGWDETPSDEVVKDWRVFQEDLLAVNLLQVPRKICTSGSVCNILIGFSDASEKAYSAVIYLRSTNEIGQHFMNLVCSKTRVAPIKKITIPRLELCGAVLLTKLMNQVREALEMQTTNVIMFTDSTIVLHWLRADPSKWNIFVANRVKEIITTGSDFEWRHVSSKDNPADLASRGTSAKQLLESTIWWTGPSWIYRNESEWPNSVLQDISNVPEAKTNHVTSLTSVVDKEFDIFNKYSSYNKLIHVMAYIQRFTFNIRNCNSRRTGPLQVCEINEAHNILIKQAQRETFLGELTALGKGQQIPKTSKILNLNPFLKEGILHVGGRLKNSDLEFLEKHPILLSSQHKLSELIVRHYHYKSLHCGPTALLAIVRSKYWITSGLVLVKRVFKKCILCFRYRPALGRQIMADLPKERFVSLRPFFCCGCDFAGPIYVKASSLRNSKSFKCYICLFVCASTKAVHLELVGSLTTEAFLSTLRRFIARRGVPSIIISDNAGNFRGTYAELKYVYDFLDQNNDSITQKLADQQIQWKFITPTAAHCGGLYESQIKQMKILLKKTLFSQILSYEDTYTVLVQIEGILNSRPICPLSSDPNDFQFLTPGHFLTTENLQTLPDPVVSKLPASQLMHYKKLINVFSSFWELWRKGYFQTLQTRGKWLTRTPPIKLHQLVLLKDDQSPPLFWKMGRVEELLPGKDGEIRSVKVKTATGVLMRHVSCLAPLPEDKDVKDTEERKENFS